MKFWCMRTYSFSLLSFAPILDNSESKGLYKVSIFVIFFYTDSALSTLPCLY